MSGLLLPEDRSVLSQSSKLYVHLVFNLTQFSPFLFKYMAGNFATNLMLHSSIL